MIGYSQTFLAKIQIVINWNEYLFSTINTTFNTRLLTFSELSIQFQRSSTVLIYKLNRIGSKIVLFLYYESFDFFTMN